MVDTLSERLAALHAEPSNVHSEPIPALMNGHGAVEPEVLEVPADVISLPIEEGTATSAHDLLPVGNDVKKETPLSDSSNATTDGADLLPITVSSAPVNGNNGHGARQTWDTLLQILEEEKARKASSRSRKKQLEKTTATTNAANLWEILEEGGKACSTTLNTTKAEELMPEATQVSQPNLW